MAWWRVGCRCAHPFEHPTEGIDEGNDKVMVVLMKCERLSYLQGNAHGQLNAGELNRVRTAVRYKGASYTERGAYMQVVTGGRSQCPSIQGNLIL